MRSENALDRLLSKLDVSVKTIAGGKSSSQRPSPATDVAENPLTDIQKARIARLMRVNHCGEVCAQALYEGQAITSRLKSTADTLRQSAIEEEDHLHWCEKRIKELGGRLSLLNPLFYISSYGLGMAAGVLGNRINLGFLAATEEEVCIHLNKHLQALPKEDLKSRSILEQMLEDEAKHASIALDAGGAIFPAGVKKLMHSVSKLMTKTAYRI